MKIVKLNQDGVAHWLVGALVVAIVAAVGVRILTASHAASLTPINASIVWTDNGSCDGTINGQGQTWYPAVAGDSVTMNLTNNSSLINVSVEISEANQDIYTTNLTPGSTASTSFTVHSEVDVNVQGTNCQSDKGGPADFYIEAASGTYTCNLVDNRIWSMNLDFTGVVGELSLYENGTLVDQFNSTGANTFDNPISFNAGKNSSGFNLYEGSNSSAPLIGQVDCPAEKVVSQPAPAPKASTPAASTPATPTPQTTTSATTTSNTPQSAAVAQLTSAVVSGKTVNLGTSVVVAQTQSISLTGKTIPGGIVTLTIHSKPRVVTTTANKSGIWNYTVSGLPPGNHYIESSVTNPSTKQVSQTTKLLSFKVSSITKSTNHVIIYIIIAIIVIVLIAGLIVALH